MALTFEEYQQKAATTAEYPQKGTGSQLALAYTTLGLNGEAGEVGELAKKFLRGDFGDSITPELLDRLTLEVGDVLWYAARVCEELKLDMGTVAQTNLDKLAERKKRGVIKGSGDLR